MTYDNIWKDGRVLSNFSLLFHYLYSCCFSLSNNKDESEITFINIGLRWKKNIVTSNLYFRSPFAVASIIIPSLHIIICFSFFIINSSYSSSCYIFHIMPRWSLLFEDMEPLLLVVSLPYGMRRKIYKNYYG